MFEKRPLDIPKGGAYSDGLKKVDDVFQDDFDMEAQIYMEWKMYDHLVKFCLHTS